MPSRSGDVPEATTEFAMETALTREWVISELEFLASFEHALCVEYLVIHCALGHDQAPPDPGDVAQRVSEAAALASAVSQDEMRHLHGVNRVLVAADRTPCVARAVSITGDAGSELPLVPPRLAEADHFLERLRAVAAAVDARYAQLRRALDPEDAVLNDAAREQLSFLLDPAPDHRAPVETLAAKLEGLAPQQYLRATRHEPAGELERRLLMLSDSHYGLVVATVEAWLANEDRLGGVLRGRSTSLMEGLNEIDGVLVERGLMPPFTQVQP